MVNLANNTEPLDPISEREKGRGKVSILLKRFLAGLKEKIKTSISSIIIFTLILLLVLVYLFNYIVYIVRPGQAAVFWSLYSGTQIDYVYGEGIHFILPVNKMYIYNVRIQEINSEFHVLTKRGLQVALHLSIRYAPKYKLLGLLHQRVGPDYVNVVIIPQVKAALRDVIGTLGSGEIYLKGREIIIEALNHAVEQVARRYINVDAVLIKRIVLPDKVANAIEYELEQKHLVEAHKFIVEKENQEAERKRIEGKGIRDQLNIIAEALPEKQILRWKGIQATEAIAKSDNTKVVIIGAGKDGLPIILNTEK